MAQIQELQEKNLKVKTAKKTAAPKSNSAKASLDKKAEPKVDKKEAPKAAFDYAVIETGGKQYIVKPGDISSVEKIDAEGKIEFDKVLLMKKGSDVKIGTPYLEEKIEAEIVEQFKSKKVIVFKFKNKSRQKKKQGHRQNLTKVKF